MKVLIMVAGVGTRISRHLQGQPKCCVNINGKPLIRHTMEMLEKKGITNIALVTGYQEEYIHQALNGLIYSKYFNPFYKIVNSIASIWFARDFLTSDEDIIIMNGDVYIEEKILEIILNENRSPVMFSDSNRIEEADYRFAWKNNKLLKFGKELPNEETNGEYIGIAKINKQDINIMKLQLEYLINKGEYHMWWEDVLYSLIQSKKCIYVKDIKGIFWAEVDFIEDYNRIIEYVKP